MKLIGILSALFCVQSIRFNAIHYGPTIMHPMRGNFIDLTAKPYLVDNHFADGKLIEDADKVLGNYINLSRY